MYTLTLGDTKLSLKIGKLLADRLNSQMARYPGDPLPSEAVLVGVGMTIGNAFDLGGKAKQVIVLDSLRYTDSQISLISRLYQNRLYRITTRDASDYEIVDMCVAVLNVNDKSIVR